MGQNRSAHRFGIQSKFLREIGSCKKRREVVSKGELKRLVMGDN
jgi:hypothetical protein